MLQQSPPATITAITGIEGLGKTELALQYAQYFAQGHDRHQIYAGGICWIRAHTPANSTPEGQESERKDPENKKLIQNAGQQIVAYAQTQLGLTIPDTLQNLPDQVAFCWANWPAGDVLLVWDDVTDYGAIEPYLPPSLPRFKLLLTTRLELGPLVQPLDLNVLSETAALELLQSLVGEGRIQAQLESAKTLCAWLGYLPLGLELVGRFLVQQPDWSLTRLQRRLIEKRLDARALSDPELRMTTAHESVAAAFELNWQELNAEAQQLGYLLSLFPPGPISWPLVEQCLPDRDAEALASLRDQGLVCASLLQQVGEQTYQLHPLLRGFFQSKLQIAAEQQVDLMAQLVRAGQIWQKEEE
jgi:hypothetical protein